MFDSGGGYGPPAQPAGEADGVGNRILFSLGAVAMFAIGVGELMLVDVAAMEGAALVEAQYAKGAAAALNASFGAAGLLTGLTGDASVRRSLTKEMDLLLGPALACTFLAENEYDPCSALLKDAFGSVNLQRGVDELAREGKPLPLLNEVATKIQDLATPTQPAVIDQKKQTDHTQAKEIKHEVR